MMKLIRFALLSLLLCGFAAGIYDLWHPVTVADGSDPMPACRGDKTVCPPLFVADGGPILKCPPPEHCPPKRVR